MNLLVQSNVKDIQYPNYLVQEHILAFIRMNPGNKQAISCLKCLIYSNSSKMILSKFQLSI